MNSLHYFGTDTRDYGHYCWDFDSTGQYMSKSQSYSDNVKFDAYKFKSERKGTVKYFIENGYSVLAITGSCKDTRGGTVSVFFANKDFTEEQIIQKVKMTPAAMKIINNMPFNVEAFNHVV